MVPNRARHHIYASYFEGRRKQYVKLYKTISESIFCNVPDYFYLKSTQRETRHSKGTPRALGHSKVTRTLEGHLGTRTLEGHLGTWALKGHSGNRALQALYLANSLRIKTVIINLLNLEVAIV